MKITINVLDIIILTILSITTAIGLWKGFVKQVLTLVGVIIGYVFALRLYITVSKNITGVDHEIAKIISFIGIFILCIILSSVLSWLIGKFLKISGLNWLNRIGGAAIGCLKGLLIITVIVVVLIVFLPSNSKLLNSSITLPYVVKTIKYANTLIPEALLIEYKKRIETLKKHWLEEQLNSGLDEIRKKSKNNNQNEVSKYF